MQDLYVGDIGDYGKYGLLRQITRNGLSLSINWYKVCPRLLGKQEDGKYIQYLNDPATYRSYDPELFDKLRDIVLQRKARNIQSVEKAHLLEAQFFSEAISGDRNLWHDTALQHTNHTDTVFLDPDNGLETWRMFLNQKATEKHVKWQEVKDYYDRGQTVILYQHRPQMTPKEACIESVMEYHKKYLRADHIFVLEFPRFTNRFYFMFTHNEHNEKINTVCNWMRTNWKGLCT